MFDYIDIHSHIYFPDFDADREEEISRMKEQHIATITVGTDFDSSQAAVDLAEKHSNMFACIGQHPGDVTLDSVFDERLTELATNPRVVAIGECGLDYVHVSTPDTQIKDIQKKIFEQQIDLSLACHKPLMLHIRSVKGSYEAYHDALEILENRVGAGETRVRGNVHFFAGSMDVLTRFLALGFSVSFTGVITFTHDYDELVRFVPLSMLMSETDAPFVAPIPHRGKRNSPLYIPEIVQKIGEIRGEDQEMVRIALRDNAERYFGLDQRF